MTLPQQNPSAPRAGQALVAPSSHRSTLVSAWLNACLSQQTVSSVRAGLFRLPRVQCKVTATVPEWRKVLMNWQPFATLVKYVTCIHLTYVAYSVSGWSLFKKTQKPTSFVLLTICTSVSSFISKMGIWVPTLGVGRLTFVVPGIHSMGHCERQHEHRHWVLCQTNHGHRPNTCRIFS